MSELEKTCAYCSAVFEISGSTYVFNTETETFPFCCEECCDNWIEERKESTIASKEIWRRAMRKAACTLLDRAVELIREAENTRPPQPERTLRKQAYELQTMASKIGNLPYESGE